MNIKSNIWPLLLLIVITGLASCKKDKTPTGPASTDEVNKWIAEKMRDAYYWSASIPADRNLNFSLQPLNFFDRLLHPDDRFSWMDKADKLEDDLAGVSTTVGLGIALARLSQNSNRLVAAVRYVLKDSPADRANIRRGELITKIDGREMTISNYQEVLAPYYGSAAFTVEISKLNSDIVTADREVRLQPVQNFQEQAIHLDTVLTTPGGKKVGYLFYNRFLNHQIDKMLEAFGRFKQAGVDELVVDLRYNVGGGILVSAVLSGLIYSGFDEDETFVRYIFNSNYRDRDESYRETFGGGESASTEDKEWANRLIQEIKNKNLGLSRVFILATENSASASELVINNLRPFMSNQNVVHIGDTTVGKNEGSVTIKDERKPPRIDWGLQPIIVKLANNQGLGDYPNGLPPSQLVDEWQYLPWVPIGSIEDPLLGRALALIDPSFQALVGKIMSVRAETARNLRPEPIEFEDNHNRLVPVYLGTSDQFHLK